MESIEINIRVDGLTYIHEIKALDDVDILKAVFNGLEEKAYKIAQGNEPTTGLTI